MSYHSGFWGLRHKEYMDEKYRENEEEKYGEKEQSRQRNIKKGKGCVYKQVEQKINGSKYMEWHTKNIIRQVEKDTESLLSFTIKTQSAKKH